MDATYIGTLKCLNDHKGTILELNGNFRQLIGYSSEELFSIFGNSFFNLIPREFLSDVCTELYRQMSNGIEFYLDFPLSKKGGSQVWIHFFGVRMSEDGVESLNAQVLNVDRYYNMITVGKRVLDSVPHPVVLLDHEERVQFINQAAQERMSIVNKDAVNLSVEMSDGQVAFKWQEDSDMAEDSLMRLSHKEAWSQWGEPESLELQVSENRDDSGNVIGYVCVEDHQPGEDRSDKNSENNQEYRYLVSLISDALTAFEVNISKDMIIRIEADWFPIDGHGVIDGTYTDLFNISVQQVVHPAYQQYVLDSFNIEALTEAYNANRHEVQCEYQRLDRNERMTWVITTAHIISSPTTGDICGLITIRDIDAQKKRELELQNKAERDPLTNLYNRATALIKINALLDPLSSRTSVLFMLDVDNFKRVNDTYGHLYGDAVLSELSQKLRNTFRREDIIGRMGGDEFVVFIYDIGYESIGLQKAENVCLAFQSVYNSGKGDCIVSGSVGVAFSPRHGTSFQELYAKADMALYSAKKQGKNRYSVFSEEHSKTHIKKRLFEYSMESEYQPQLTASNKSENVVECVFKIMHYTENTSMATLAALELIAHHADVEHAYIFTLNPETDKFSVLAQWYSPDSKIEMKSVSDELSWEQLAQWNELSLDRQSMYLKKSKSAVDVAPFLLWHETRTSLQCAIIIRGVLKGFIGLDEHCKGYDFPKSDKAMLKAVAEVMGVFIK